MRRLARLWDDPVLMRRLNGWATVGFLLLIPVAALAGWLTSVTFVSALSLWALVSGHLSAWQAARVEVRQVEEDVPGEVVERVVAHTTIERVEADGS